MYIIISNIFRWWCRNPYGLGLEFYLSLELIQTKGEVRRADGGPGREICKARRPEEICKARLPEVDD